MMNQPATNEKSTKKNRIQPRKTQKYQLNSKLRINQRKWGVNQQINWVYQKRMRIQPSMLRYEPVTNGEENFPSRIGYQVEFDVLLA